MQDWDMYKRAALEYSRLQPRLVSATLTPAPNVKAQALPADCIGVQFLAWGEEWTFLEVATSETETQGWAAEGSQVFLTPAPADTTPIAMVYLALHQPNEETQTFPTIPAAHLPHVDDLEQAVLLEVEADDMARGPTLYTLGQTQVSREAALADLRARALALRTRVRLALEAPLGLWR